MSYFDDTLAERQLRLHSSRDARVEPLLAPLAALLIVMGLSPGVPGPAWAALGAVALFATLRTVVLVQAEVLSELAPRAWLFLVWVGALGVSMGWAGLLWVVVDTDPGMFALAAGVTGMLALAMTLTTSTEPPLLLLAVLILGGTVARGFEVVGADTAHYFVLLLFMAYLLALARLSLRHRRTMVNNAATLAERTRQLNITNRELDASQLEIERASRAKNTLLATTSHELRTPVANLVGTLDQMLQEEMPRSVGSRLQRMRENGEALLRMLEELLDLSRVDAGGVKLQRRPMELRRTIAQAVAGFQARARSQGVELCLEIEDAVPVSVRGDPLRLVQVLNNLIGNALRHCGRGVVQVTVQVQGEGDTRRTIRCLVSDSGPGIPSDRLDAIFEPFEQGHADRSEADGAGLGLAIVKSLVTAMGGRVGVDSVLGAGTTFWFEVPVEPVNELAALEGSGGVLYVEDNPESRELMDALLQRLGHRCVAVDSLSAAEQVVRDRPFEAILLDGRLGDGSGFELAAQIRHRPGPNRSAPLFAVTADASEDAYRRAQRAGMDDVFVKPVREQDLRDRLLPWIGSAVDNRAAGSVLDLGRVHELAALGRTENLVSLLDEFAQRVRAKLESNELAPLIPLARSFGLKSFAAELQTNGAGSEEETANLSTSFERSLGVLKDTLGLG